MTETEGSPDDQSSAGEPESRAGGEAAARPTPRGRPRRRRRRAAGREPAASAGTEDGPLEAPDGPDASRSPPLPEAAPLARPPAEEERLEPGRPLEATAGRHQEEAEREPAERPRAASVRDDGQPADIDPERLDADGIKILNRLHRYGHQAYFVGGCVRDLLLGRAPKDFDICTSAHPGEVRSLFRNCRLIGRRFRLAHVFFRGGKIIEVSTFRANPMEVESGDELPEDLLITRDNVFGTAEEDALRRDFTVNGLFYDIRLGRVIDYVGGRRDLEARLVRTIGDPEIRMREDPVRLLRAVRFASRLGFDIDPATYAAMEAATEDLSRCAPARLLEEVMKLLRSGASRNALSLLRALGALRVLLPPVAEYLDAHGEPAFEAMLARMEAMDARVQKAPLDDSLIIATLLSPIARAAATEVAAGRAVDAVLEQMVQTARLPRRIADRCRQLLWAQGVLLGERRRRRSLASFRNHPLFTDALLLAEIGAAANGEGRELVETWLAGRAPSERGPGAGAAGGTRRRRRRRRRGRRGGGEEPARSLG